MTPRLLLGLTGVVLAIGAIGGPAHTQTAPADLVMTNGTIITVDPRDTIAQALAVRGGKIVFVGSTAEAKALIGAQTQVIDLAGRTA